MRVNSVFNKIFNVDHCRATTFRPAHKKNSWTNAGSRHIDHLGQSIDSIVDMKLNLISRKHCKSNRKLAEFRIENQPSRVAR